MGHYGSGKSTVGRLICEEEVARNGRKKVIYVCFSNNSDGEEVKEQFKADLKKAVKWLCLEIDVQRPDCIGTLYCWNRLITLASSAHHLV